MNLTIFQYATAHPRVGLKLYNAEASVEALWCFPEANPNVCGWSVQSLPPGLVGKTLGQFCPVLPWVQ